MKIDLKQPLKVHFIGIGGVSMSGLARILHKNGFQVSGSDIHGSALTKSLEELGVRVHIGHKADNLADDVALVVYTVAVKQENPEWMKAVSLDIPIIDRATLLGDVMDGYENSIAVAGTHGKTTTTSMVSHILWEARKDPTISVGGILPLIDSNIYVGDTDYFVTEACEYYNSYHHFNPKVALTLNVEEDHMDFFEDIEAIRTSFRKFHGNVAEDGLLVINGDTLALDALTHDLPCQVVTYGLKNPSTDYYAKNITYNKLGHPTFDCMYQGQLLGTVSLSVIGEHNVANALGAIAVARYFDICINDIREGLKAFGGTKRRFEYKGDLGGVHVIDDYAHHPTEIAATIAAARNMETGNLRVIFQPHTFSRTKAFFEEFAMALSAADEVILMDIYSAGREVDPGDIHSRDLAERIVALGGKATYLSTIDEITYHILTHALPGDLLITMGAGDVYLVGESLLEP